MSKCRIIKEYGLYYPQQKNLFWWQSTSDPVSTYHTVEEAIEGIEQHKRILEKIHKVDIV